MTQRKRKLWGTVALLVFITLYALLALAFAAVLQVREANGVVEVLYYIVAGLAWVEQPAQHGGYAWMVILSLRYSIWRSAALANLSG